MDKTTPTTEAREQLKAALEAAVTVTTAEVSSTLERMLAVKALNPEPSELEPTQSKMPVPIFDFNFPELTAVHQQIGEMVKDVIKPIGMFEGLSTLIKSTVEKAKDIASGQLTETFERFTSMAQNIRIDAGKRFEILNDSLNKAKARAIRLEQTYGKAFQAASSRKEEIPALEERLLAGVPLQSLTLEDLYLASYIGLNGGIPHLRQNVAREIARRKIKDRCQLLIEMFGLFFALTIQEHTRAWAKKQSTRAPPNPFTKFQPNAQPNAPNLTTAS